MLVSERSELETTMTAWGGDTVAFTWTSNKRDIYVINGDLGRRLAAYWNMCVSDREFWEMVDTHRSNGFGDWEVIHG